MLKESMLAVGLATAACPAMGQDYPAKVVRIVVPFTPGGSTDIAARIVAERLTRSLKQSVIVENRAGANGIIGAEYVARSAPDGYTVFLGNLGTLAINPAINDKLPYNPATDFAPVAMAAVSPLILIAHPSTGIRTVGDLIAKAKADPDKLTFSTAGIGAAAHMAAELFNFMTGIRTVHVPYKGAAPATAAVASGEVTYSFSGQGPSWPMVNAGRVTGVALTGASRSTERPQTPTVQESGVPGYEVLDWNGFLLPAGAPREIVVKLNSEINQVLNPPEARTAFLAQGLEPSPRTPEQFAAFIKSEQEKWEKVARAAKIRASQ